MILLELEISIMNFVNSFKEVRVLSNPACYHAVLSTTLTQFKIYVTYMKDELGQIFLNHVSLEYLSGFDE